MAVPVTHELDIQPVELFQIREVLRCILHTIMFNRALGLVIPKTVESELFDSISYVKCGDPSIERKVDEKIEQLCSLVERSPSFAAAASTSTHASTHLASLSSSDSNLTKAQLNLSFFERRQVKRSNSASGVGSWFGVGSGSGKLNPSASASSSQSDSSINTQKGACWEQWVLNLSVVPPRVAKQRSSQDQHQQQQLTHQQSGGSQETSFESAERVRRSANLEAELREVLLTVLLLANQSRPSIPPVLTTDIVPFPYDITVPSLSESTFGLDLLKRMLQATPPPLLT